jgi:hypothetical protein
MAQVGYTTIQIYHSSTSGSQPSAGNLVEGELGINTTDRKMFTKNSSGLVVPIGGGAAGGGANGVFYENDTNVTVSYTITTGKNAMSAGPITVDSGVVVTVPSGSVWTIV